MSEVGLRDVKRAATARALSRAAFELALERGVDGFTIDDVAGRAGYSRRTFANHYSCKEEAIAAVILESVREGISVEVDVPEDAPLLDWVSAVARRQLSGPMLGMLGQLQSLAEGHPSLDPWLLEVQRKIRTVALELVSQRAGSRYSALYTHLLVGAVYGALAAVLEGPFDLRPPGGGADADADAGALSVDTFLDTTLAHLRAGF